MTCPMDSCSDEDRALVDIFVIKNERELEIPIIRKPSQGHDRNPRQTICMALKNTVQKPATDAARMCFLVIASAVVIPSVSTQDQALKVKISCVSRVLHCHGAMNFEHGRSKVIGRPWRRLSSHVGCIKADCGCGGMHRPPPPLESFYHVPFFLHSHVCPCV